MKEELDIVKKALKTVATIYKFKDEEGWGYGYTVTDMSPREAPDILYELEKLKKEIFEFAEKNKW